jgi:hypothetical protein
MEEVHLFWIWTDVPAFPLDQGFSEAPCLSQGTLFLPTPPNPDRSAEGPGQCGESDADHCLK